MANGYMGAGRAGWGSTGETLTGFLPPPLSSLLPCSGEVLDLVRGEGQLVRITICADCGPGFQRCLLGCREAGDFCQNEHGGPGGK